MSTDQNVTSSSAVKVNFDSTLFDTTSIFNATLDRFDIDTTGYYRVSVKLYLSSYTTERCIVSVRKN